MRSIDYVEKDIDDFTRAIRSLRDRLRRIIALVRARRRRRVIRKGERYAAYYAKKGVFKNQPRGFAVVINVKNGALIARENVRDAIEEYRKVHGNAPGYVYPRRSLPEEAE